MGTERMASLGQHSLMQCVYEPALGGVPYGGSEARAAAAGVAFG